MIVIIRCFVLTILLFCVTVTMYKVFVDAKNRLVEPRYTYINNGAVVDLDSVLAVSYNLEKTEFKVAFKDFSSLTFNVDEQNANVIMSDLISKLNKRR